jgi:hypothetical protein
MLPITISDNTHYKIAISPEANRAYLTIHGFWRNKDAVPNYLKDWTKAVSALKPGFTLLTDASEMKTHPKDVQRLHEEAQAIVLKAGVVKVAEILKDNITELQLNAVAKATQFPKKNFKTVEEAEKWLDQQ